MKDTIYRQDAIDAVAIPPEWDGMYIQDLNGRIREAIEQLPSAQPEIIRCKDCKYNDENWRRVSTVWLPCMDMRMGSNWFCGYAERREDG